MCACLRVCPRVWRGHVDHGRAGVLGSPPSKKTRVPAAAPSPACVPAGSLEGQLQGFRKAHSRESYLVSRLVFSVLLSGSLNWIVDFASVVKMTFDA